MKDNHIVILDAYTTNPGDLSWSPLQTFGEVKVYDRTAPEQLIDRGRGANIVLTNKVVLGREEMDQLPDLQYIGILATGYNNVDIQAAREKNISVCNVAGYSTQAVAQQVFALLLALLNRVEIHDQHVREGGWQNSPDWHYTLLPIEDLAGKTLGIYGLGTIGKAVARAAVAFDMQVIATRRDPAKGAPQGVRLVDEETLLTESDILSLHAPLSKENTGFIRQATIEKMKPGAILINTGRGGLVREEDLAKALNDGRLAGAGLDVLVEEPPRSGSPLIGAKNCLITPHLAWGSVASRKRLIEETARNIKSFLEGGNRNRLW
jgi:glycerate dehydrogenase